MGGRPKRTAFSVAVNIAVRGKNDSVMRFLYAITKEPTYYNIAGWTLLPSENEDGQVEAWIQVDRLASVPGISLPGDGLSDPETALPMSMRQNGENIGLQIYREELESQKEKGWDPHQVMAQALKRKGLYQDSMLAKIETELWGKTNQTETTTEAASEEQATTATESN